MNSFIKIEIEKENNYTIKKVILDIITKEREIIIISLIVLMPEVIDSKIKLMINYKLFNTTLTIADLVILITNIIMINYHYLRLP